jgi:hypothetical protein
MRGILRNRERTPRYSGKERLEIVQSILAIAAILAGLCWFFMQGIVKPNVKMEQVVSQRHLAKTPSTSLIWVEVRATNLGKVPVHLHNGSLIMTLDDPEQKGLQTIGDPVPLQELTLSPGESDQAVVHAYELPLGYNVVSIQSQYQVPPTILGFEVPFRSSKWIWRVENPVFVGADPH